MEHNVSSIRQCRQKKPSSREKVTVFFRAHAECLDLPPRGLRPRAYFGCRLSVVTGGRVESELYALVYDELKGIAHRHLRDAGGGDTLSTTELVHEAYLKLSRAPGSQWDNRGHFFGAASRAMRQILVDFARKRQALKHGGAQERVTLDSSNTALELQLDDMLALDAALDRLNAVDERLREVVELRFFGGLPETEIAELLGVTARTVERDWVKARLFLLRELDPMARSGK
jgi:RNA polymerase sigma factor (TIGR02999 family)